MKNAAKNWKALDVFTFEFFRDLRPKDCQFFPYKRKETQYFQVLEVNIMWHTRGGPQIMRIFGPV